MCRAANSNGQITACPNSLFNPWVTSVITLPDGNSYHLYYDSYGNVARVVLPTGGAVEYDYGAWDYNSGGSQPYTWTLFLTITQRREYLHSTDTTPYRVDKFSAFNGNFAGVVMHYDGNGNLLAKETHAVNSSFEPPFDASADNPWMDGKESETKYYAGDARR